MTSTTAAGSARPVPPLSSQSSRSSLRSPLSIVNRFPRAGLPAAGPGPRLPQPDSRALLLAVGVLLWLAMTVAGPPHPAYASIVLHPDQPPYPRATALPPRLDSLLPVGRSPADVLSRFDPPPLPWAAGHRGVDLAAAVGDPVRAARGGVVSFVGTIAGTGVVTVTHPGTGEPALRTTYEPVSPTVTAGSRVTTGETVGTLATGPWHCSRSCLHWGLLRGQRYLDPLALLGLGHARLLPEQPGPGSGGQAVGAVTPWSTRATALSVMAVGSSAAPISSRFTADSTTPCTRTAVSPGCRCPRSARAATTTSTSPPCAARIRSRAVSSSSPAEMAATARCLGSPARASCARTYASTRASGERWAATAPATSAAQAGKSTAQSSATTAAREPKYSYTEERARPVRRARLGKVSASIPPSVSSARAASSSASRCN